MTQLKARRDDSDAQFAEYAVEQNDLDNYLGFADTALGHLHFHHHFEGTSVCG
jgi:hypothetical protein